MSTLSPRFRSIALGAALFLAPPAGAQEFTAPAAWTRAIEPFRIAEGLYWVGSADLAAGDARAFVDPGGYDAYLDRALESIERTLAEQGFAGGCELVLAGD